MSLEGLKPEINRSFLNLMQKLTAALGKRVGTTLNAPEVHTLGCFSRYFFRKGAFAGSGQAVLFKIWEMEIKGMALKLTVGEIEI
jgi:hypothetical protein